MRALLLLLALAVLAAPACTPSRLTAAEEAKLDPALQALLHQAGLPDARYTTMQRADGTMAFSVILRVDDAEAVRAAGLPLRSVVGDVATAFLTREEIRRAARLAAVRHISNDTKLIPEQGSNP